MDEPFLRFWPRGLPRELQVPRVTLLDYLSVAAHRYPEKPAIVYGGRALCYSELWRRVQALAGWLQREAGVRHGDRVLLMTQNCPQSVVAFYAVLCAGAVVVPVNPMSTAPELRHHAADSGSRLIVVAQELLPVLLAQLGDAGEGGLDRALVLAYGDALCDSVAPLVDPEGEAELPALFRQARAPLPHPACHGFEEAIAQNLDPLPVQASPEDLAVLPYTSGTTGLPKGCMHTHATVLASNLASQIWRGLHAESVFLCVAPLFHMLGMQNGMNVPVTLGATVVMMPRWHAPTALRLMERHRVSVWAAPPAMVIDCFAQPEAATRDLSSLALLSGGGAAMPEAVAALLAERFGIQYNEAYGLSETASFLHANPVARGKRQCLGVPTPGVYSRVVDPETLADLPAGEVGELVTRGPQLMLGYWRNPEADRAAFFERDGHRWFRTGDLASVDPEGYFFMRDRLKRMINASGFKVWPAEVENALYEHPAVHEACVIAVPDALRGETVKALVVLKPQARGTVTEQALVDWGRTRMAVYKAPRIVEFRDALPKSGTGKILWRELQAAAAADAAVAPPPSAVTARPLPSH